MVLILDKIKVAVRIRPPSDSNYDIMTKVDKHFIFLKDKHFNFDYVFDIFSQQECIFETSVLPLIESFLLGINISILAYGQTGSGKTHTMGTNITEHCQGKFDTGIIPRTLDYIFSLNMFKNGEAECNIQFLELYNEEVRDLFQQKGRNSVIRLVDGKSGVIVSGLSLRNVRSVNEAMASLHEGGRARTTAATAMNAESSRSHAIFTVILTQTRFNEFGIREVISSKFNFVDLAGSERLNKTGAVGNRAKEGININFGLLALGNVINALAESVSDIVGKAKRHIPYRDSKLTRLLEDSLGGNSKCLMIACICPSRYNAAESLNTLNYAARVKNIENRISINHQTVIDTQSDTATCQRLQQRIVELERELKQVKETAKDSKFVTEAQNILKLQSQANNVTFKNAMENVDSLCYLLSLEHDSNLMDCFPDKLMTQNTTLSFEKSLLNNKIKSIKQCSDENYLNNIQTMSLLDHFMNKIEESQKINGLKLNGVAINNAANLKSLPEATSHELRWKYLLNFISQRYILTDCVYKEAIKQYDNMLSKSYKIIKSTLSNMTHEPHIVNDILCQIKQSKLNRSSITERQTPILSVRNLEQKLEYFFPLDLIKDNPVYESKVTDKVIPSVSSDIYKAAQSSLMETRQEPMETEKYYTQTKTFRRSIKTLQRKRSMKLSDQRFNVINEKQVFVNRNGLCLPIIKSPVKSIESRAIKRSHTVIENVSKRPILAPVTNHSQKIAKDEELRKYLSKKPIVNANSILENFRLRNMLRR